MIARFLNFEKKNNWRDCYTKDIMLNWRDFVTLEEIMFNWRDFVTLERLCYTG